MNTNLQERPQSKRRVSLQQRPPTRTIHKQQAQKCFSMAKQHQLRNQYKQAIKLYAETVVHNPNFYKAYCNVGVIYRKLGQIHDAIASYLKALQIKKDDFKTLYNLGNSYRLIGNNQKAIIAYKLVLEATEKDQQLLSLKHDALNNLGVSYQNVYRYQQAIQCYQKVIAADQKFQGGYYNKALGLMCLIRKTNKNLPATLKMRIDETQKSLNKVLQINPNNLLTSVYLIELKYIKNPEKNTYEQCIQNLKILITKPNIISNIHDQISIKIGFCLAELKKFEQSTKYYKDGTQKSSTQLIQQKIQPSLQKKQVNKYDEKDKVIKQTENKLVKIEQIKTSKNHKSLESLQQSNTGKEVHNNIEVEKQKVSKKYVQQNKQRQSKKQIFIKQFKQIAPLIQSKNYKEALRKLENFSICQEKYNQQILLYAKATQQYEDISFAKEAINLYARQIIGNRSNKAPLFADCTIEAHRALSECYTVLGQHQQAIKHYKLISDWLQSNMHERDIDLFVESGLGINYESLGLYNDAIECYKKSLQMQPDNYHTLYNLANCYLQDKKEQQAYTMLEKCMQKINSKEDWMILGDCYINKALIQGQRNQKIKELDTLQKLMKLFDENCKSLQQLKTNYNSQMLIEVYLELAMLIQEKLQMNGKNQTDQAIIQQNKNKLLNIYMTLLEFPQCPDKQEIILNCGNIHFQKKQYINSVYFYHSLNQQLATNYLGLTYLFLGQFGKSHGWLTHSVSSSSNNSIYMINLALVDWLFSQDSQYTKKYAITAFNTAYSCKCDRFFDFKLLFAQQFIVQLTQLLTDIQQYLPIEQINQKIQEVIKIMKDKSKADKAKLSKHETSKLKKKALIFDKLDNHCRNHQREKQLQEKEVIHLNDLMEFFAQAVNINESFKKLLSFINNIDDNHPLYPTIIQTLLSIFIITNSENIKQVKDTFIQLVLKQVPVLTLKNINKPILNNAPKIILQKGMQREQIIQQIREWERELQELYTPIVQDIKTKYWLSENITQPIKMFYNYPHCGLNQECQQCFLKSYAFLATILGRSKQFQEIIKKHNSLLQQQKIIKSLQETFNGRTQETLKVTIQKNLPVTLHWYFENSKSVESFLQQLSQYNIQAEGNKLIINNIVAVEVHIGKLNYIQDYISKVMEYPINIQILAVFALDNQNQQCFLGTKNQETFNAYLQWKRKNNLIK